MTSSSFNDAGRRHELRTACGLPVSGAKLPNCGLDNHALSGRVAEHSSPAGKNHLQSSRAPHRSRLRTVPCAFRRLRFEETIFGRVQLLELAWLSAAHIILVAEPQREEYQPFVRGVVSARARGLALGELELQEVLPAGDARESRTPQETAVLRQSMRLVWLVVTVLEEEERAQPAAAAEAPQPFIPGTS